MNEQIDNKMGKKMHRESERQREGYETKNQNQNNLHEDDRINTKIIS